MTYSMEFFKMTHDGVLEAARTTLSSLPESDQLMAELKAQLALAHATQAQLRSDMRELVSEYRVWRREASCGRAVSNIVLLHPTFMKQTRRVWATYRLTQLLLRDMHSMAMLRARANEMTQRIPAHAFMAKAMPQPANEQTVDFNEDGISYNALETKYGPVLAQRLYDEIMAQLQEDRIRLAKH